MQLVSMGHVTLEKGVIFFLPPLNPVLLVPVERSFVALRPHALSPSDRSEREVPCRSSMAQSSPNSGRSSGRRLDAAVEDLLERIRREQSLLPADPLAREMLSRIGEDASLRLLNSISGSRIRNLSAYIIFMAKKIIAGAAAPDNDAAPYREIHCCSPASSSPSSVFSSNRRVFDELGEITSKLEISPSPPSTQQSPHMVALGKMEFKRAFFILSYVGRKNLEDVVSVDTILKLSSSPFGSFESQVWGSIGSKCIPESDRRKNIDFSSMKTHVYECYVDTLGNFTFKGPCLQATRTHLQRVLGDENVLLVKFAEDSLGEKKPDEHVYHKIAKDGIKVGLRQYQFFVSKDAQKEEKKKTPTSSSMKCYFVRMGSDWAMDLDKPYVLLNKSIHEARSIFMHVHMVSSFPKYMARFSLILSKTFKLEVDFSSVHIKIIEDIPCMDKDGNPVMNDSGQMIHTDGTGYISHDLVLKCPGFSSMGKLLSTDVAKISVDEASLLETSLASRSFGSTTCEPPLLMQVRLFYNGRAVKGTLLVDKRLSPNTICIRPSMIKVEPDPRILNITCCNSLEVVTTSHAPKKAFFSRYLISLLHYGGVPGEYFLDLLMASLNDAQEVAFNRKAALKVALNFENMDDYILSMISCGIPLDEPYLQSRLSWMLREEKKGLQKGKILASESYYLMGTSDPSGTLKPQEVCIILENGQLSGDVLVYRNPGLHCGDIHILKATYIKDIEFVVGNSKYGIFFPTCGQRSLADEMAGGDFDGDMYWVSRNPELLNHFKQSKPWLCTTPARKSSQENFSELSSSELEKKLVEQFLMNRFNRSYTASTAADSWLVFMDQLLALRDECDDKKEHFLRKIQQLTDIYYDALDAPKSGLKPEVPDELKAQRYPHFMERTQTYHSTSILGQIYDTASNFCVKSANPKEIFLLPCFSGDVPLSCTKLWTERYKGYRAEMSEALVETDKESKDLRAAEILHKYKQLLYGADEFQKSTRNRKDVLDEALAIYQIVYKYAARINEVGRCSFAWKVAGQALCFLHTLKQEDAFPILCLPSVLREILR